MPDDLTKSRPNDSKRIDINQPYEVKFWCKEFNVTEDELKEAVRKVGTSAYKVWLYLLKI